MIDPLLLCLAMFVVTCGLLLAGFPVAFTLAGGGLAFAGLGHLLGAFDIALLTAVPQRLFATMTNDILVAVPLFVFMGVMLEKSRIAEDLLDNMGRLFGRFPGGLGISVCIVGALLAASTGIVGATVVTMGLLALPTMLRRGYNVPLAAGTIAASGTLGQIIPPSIVLIILGEQLSVAYRNAQLEQGIFAPDTISVNDLFAGAMIPGLLLVGLYICYIMFVAWRRPGDVPPVPDMEKSDLPVRAQMGQLLLALAAPLLLIIAVLGSILAGLASPAEASSVGAVGAIFLAGYRADQQRRRGVFMAVLALGGLLLLAQIFDLRLQRDQIATVDLVAIFAALVLSVVALAGLAQAILRVYFQSTDKDASVLVAVMRSAMKISSMIFMILIGASIFSLVFRGFGGDLWVESFLIALPGGVMTAMFVVMAVMFVMGFFLDFLEIVFIVVPIVAPILLQMEMPGGGLMSPVWLGVMMAVNLQTSFLTPPFGFALFYLRGVAPANVRTSEIYRGVMPFVLIQLSLLFVLWHLPEISTWLPSILYGP